MWFRKKETEMPVSQRLPDANEKAKIDLPTWAPLTDEECVDRVLKFKIENYNELNPRQLGAVVASYERASGLTGGFINLRGLQKGVFSYVILKPIEERDRIHAEREKEADEKTLALVRITQLTDSTPNVKVTGLAPEKGD